MIQIQILVPFLVVSHKGLSLGSYYSYYILISHLMHTILFADDTTILIESDHVSTALKLMNKELQKLNTWLTANKLNLNI